MTMHNESCLNARGTVDGHADDRLRRAEAIIHLTSSVRLDQPLTVLARRLVRSACEILGYSSAYLYLAEQNGDMYRLAAGYEVPPNKWLDTATAILTRTDVESLCAPPYRRGARSAYISSDAAIWATTVRAPLELGPTVMQETPARRGNLLILPLVTSWTGRIGFLVPGSSNLLEEPSESTMDLAESFALAAASLVQNAALYQEQTARAMGLEERDSARRDFVSAVSHELRTPLTAIIGFSETLLGYWDGVPDEQRRLLVEKSQSAAYRLNRLVQDLLLVSRIDAHSVTLHPRRVRLLTLVEQAASEVRGKYGDERIRVVVPTEIEVYADGHRVEQVLVNLVDNAAKYSDDPQPIMISATWWDGEVVVRVRDYGRGVDPEMASILFTRFGRIESTVRGGHVGMGLGLYISKGLVENMGGRIWVEAPEDGGAIFAFSLPLAVDGAAPALPSGPEHGRTTGPIAHDDRGGRAGEPRTYVYAAPSASQEPPERDESADRVSRVLHALSAQGSARGKDAEAPRAAIAPLGDAVTEKNDRFRVEMEQGPRDAADDQALAHGSSGAGVSPWRP